ESEYRKGLQLAPSDPMLSRYLAETLDAEGNQGEAVDAYCVAASTIMETDLQTAARLASRALEIEPTHARALEIAVNIELKQGNPDGSLAIVDAALKHDPHHAFALGVKGWLLRRYGDLNQAKETLLAANVEGPKLVWVMVELAGTLHQLNYSEQALNLIDKALDLDPRNSDALYVRAQILMEREPSGAIPVLKDAIEINPQNPFLQYE